MPETDWRAFTGRVATSLGTRGFDLVHPFRTAWWDDVVEPAERLPGFARADALALLIGNTRVLWPYFALALEREPARRDEASPLDRWVEESVTAVLAESAARHRLRFAH